MIRLIDLDNCISDDGWRIDYLRAKDYHGYHSRSIFDRPANLHILKGDPDDTNIIITSRSERYQYETVLWLSEHRISYDALLMRADKDQAPSPVVKCALLHSHLLQERITVDWIRCAFDDRTDILKAYRALGIRNTQRIFIHEDYV